MEKKREPKYWLKVFGIKGKNATKIFVNDDKIFFSEKAKKDVNNQMQKGDFVLMTAHTHKFIISTFEITDSEFKESNLNDFDSQESLNKFPFYLSCKNLNPSYFKDWKINKLTYKELDLLFFDTNNTYGNNREIPLTSAINSKSHIEISKEFYEFVVEEMNTKRAFLLIGHSNWGKSETLFRLTGNSRQKRNIIISKMELHVKRSSNDDNSTKLLDFVKNKNHLLQIIAFCPNFDNPERKSKEILEVLKVKGYQISFFVLKYKFNSQDIMITDSEIEELKNYGNCEIYNESEEAEIRAEKFKTFIIKTLQK